MFIIAGCPDLITPPLVLSDANDDDVQGEVVVVIVVVVFNSRYAAATWGGGGSGAHLWLYLFTHAVLVF
jgi:hypothetical protein